MAQFLGDLAFVAEMALLAAGLVLLDQAKASGGGLRRAAAAVLIVTGIGGGLCTGYFWMHYWGQGDFAQAWPPVAAQLQPGR